MFLPAPLLAASSSGRNENACSVSNLREQASQWPSNGGRADPVFPQSLQWYVSLDMYAWQKEMGSGAYVEFSCRTQAATYLATSSPNSSCLMRLMISTPAIN